MKLPSHLKVPGRKWAKKISEMLNVSEGESDAIIMAAECINRMASAREQIDRDGVTVNDRFGIPKCHPAVIVERDQKVLFLQICRSLKIFNQMAGVDPLAQAGFPGM
jgi:hypothetical protein